jgi:hypothetical protein
MRYVIEHRALQRKGKCILCDEPIERNSERVSVITFWENGHYVSKSICDDCLDLMVRIKDEDLEEHNE